MTNQKIIDDLMKEYDEYAKNNGFQLNPDKKAVERIINGLLRNEEKYGKNGKSYSGNREIIF